MNVYNTMSLKKFIVIMLEKTGGLNLLFIGLVKSVNRINGHICMNYSYTYSHRNI